MKYDIKCSSCGKFISYKELDKCKRTFVPSSDVSYEEDYIHCPICSEIHGKPIPTQSVNMKFV